MLVSLPNVLLCITDSCKEEKENLIFFLFNFVLWLISGFLSELYNKLVIQLKFILLTKH